MKHKPLILLAALLAAATLRAGAQQADTARCHTAHRFTIGQVAAPGALIAAGSAVAAVPSLHSDLDIGLRDRVQADGHSRLEVENTVQYLPLGSVLLLKACGLQSRHSWRDLASLYAGSCLVGAAVGLGMKYGIGVERPYGGVYNSFPSGHTLTAFLGAELLRREYGADYPGIAVAGYAVATGVGLMRIYNNRHWASDVLCGAGIGILSVSLNYWLAPYLRF